ncbi:MAG: hypothetical protein RLO21_18980, partial [Nitratireductor sp.]
MLHDFKMERERLAEANRGLNIGDTNVSYVTLYDMGAMVDGERLKSGIEIGDASQISYDATILSDYLRKQSAERLEALKLLRRQIEPAVNHEQNNAPRPIIVGHAEEAARLTQNIMDNVALDTGHVNSAFWQGLFASHFSEYSNFTARSLNAVSAIDKFSLGLGTVQAVIAFVNYARRREAGVIQDSREHTALALAATGLGVELGMPLIVSGSQLFGNWLASSYSKFQHVRNAGIAIAKRTGGALGILTAGIDIYGAVDAFTALGNAKTDQEKQDLEVAGSLSVLGAAVGIGVSVGVMAAASAAAALTWSGVGAVLGLGLLVGGAIYSAVRQVEEIKKQISLDGWQTFVEGFRAFFGLGPSAATKRKLRTAQLNSNLGGVIEDVNAELRAKFEVNALALLAGDSVRDDDGRMGGIVFTYTDGAPVVIENATILKVESSYKPGTGATRKSIVWESGPLFTPEEIAAETARANAFISTQPGWKTYGKRRNGSPKTARLS